MNKNLICISLCLCMSGLMSTSTAWAKNNSHCPNADVVLSKQYPNFDLDHGCAYNADDECDPEYSNIVDDEINGLVIAGSNGKNVIHGSSGPDTICGRNGNDEIYGEDGDDSIYGDNGNDKLYGGLGNDEVFGGNGKDDLSGYDDDNDNAAGLADGEEDDDSLYGENGKDELTGGPGDDYLSGGNGKDFMDGGDGDDDVDGGKGKDDCVDTDDDLFMDDEDVDECEDTELEDGPRHK